ncbi:MAG: hypothetical protein NWF05_08070, partial [Candidatus Bathyarchaeota archaeon]|nr:hypothetical protein [Candidatus Bathyarchaeota archaeon]
MMSKQDDRPVTRAEFEFLVSYVKALEREFEVLVKNVNKLMDASEVNREAVNSMIDTFEKNQQGMKELSTQLEALNDMFQNFNKKAA